VRHASSASRKRATGSNDVKPSLEQLREAVATRIMGWHQGDRSWAYSGGATLWYDASGVGLLPMQAWRPDEDPQQCAQVIDRMETLGFAYRMHGDSGRTEAVFYPSGRAPPTPHTHQERRRAILEAALEAICRPDQA